LAWLGVAAVAAACFRGSSLLTWAAPLGVAAYVAARAASSRRLAGVRWLAIVDIGVPLVGATLLMAVTGGWSSPFAALYFLNVAEGVAMRGAGGGVEAAIGAAVLGMAHLRSGVGPQAALALGFAAGLLVLAALLLHLAGAAGEEDRTVLKQRTVEELDRRLEELGEQHHRLRASYRDLAAAARDQRDRIQTVSVGQSILAASAETDDEEVLQDRILQLLARAFGARGAVLWWADRSGGVLRVRSSWGAVARVVAESPIPFLAGMQPGDARRACEERLMLTMPAPPGGRGRAQESGKDLVELATAESRAVLGLALRDGDELLGVIALCCASDGSFTDEQAETLNDLRDAVALALKNVTERARLRGSIREVSLLHELSGLARSAVDIGAVCDGALAALQRHIAFENATLFLLDASAGRLTPRATRGQMVNLIDHIAFDTGNGLSGWVAQKRKVLTIDDVLDERGLLHAELIPPDVRSFAAIPLMRQDRVTGVLNLSHSRPHAFTPDDIRLASIVAGQTALAVEEAESIQRSEVTAILDPLTGVLTRRHFRQRFEEEVRRSERYGLAAALVLVDVDRMEQINLERGTAAGDRLLAELGRLLRRNLRASDLVGRQSGDGFAALLTHTAEVDALNAAARLVDLVREAELDPAYGDPLKVTISASVTAYPEGGSTPDELMALAESALAETKALGGNRVGRARREGRNEPA
jgi:diguanylate cyclase (GGDEF)-like protein